MYCSKCFWFFLGNAKRTRGIDYLAFCYFSSKMRARLKLPMFTSLKRNN
ncbi:hypothetical protein AsAng_0043450 [Aureispira anguillae]|uniref:Uncharacterized protein n=1 Tax=Aureispira anguillae TaxID=2864201 RepID=A0A915YII9_9BACT|nr:hypothetical protein AsAng_0043450 [Aureispira anguillae]